MKLKSAIIAAVTGAAILAAPAGATTRQRVSYADLNLTSAEGQATLQARLNKAAWAACLYDSAGMVRSADDSANCYRSARKDVAVRMASLVADFQRGG